MVGKFLGLEEVPVHLGFFIGSVVALPRGPQPTSCAGSLPKINRDDNATWPTQQEHRTGQLLAHGRRHGGDLGRFRSASAVVAAEISWTELVFLCIAGAQLISGLNVSNNNHLGLSKHYGSCCRSGPGGGAVAIITCSWWYSSGAWPERRWPRWAPSCGTTRGACSSFTGSSACTHSRGPFPSCRGSPLRLRCFSTGTPEQSGFTRWSKPLRKGRWPPVRASQRPMPWGTFLNCETDSSSGFPGGPDPAFTGATRSACGTGNRCSRGL